MRGDCNQAVGLTLESSSTSPLNGASPASFMSPMRRADCAWKRRVSSSTSCTEQYSVNWRLQKYDDSLDLRRHSVRLAGQTPRLLYTMQECA